MLSDDERLARALAEFTVTVDEDNALWRAVDGGRLRGADLARAERRLVLLDTRGRRLVREAEAAQASAGAGLVAKAGLLRLRDDPWRTGDIRQVEAMERLGWSLADDVLRFFGGRPA